MMKSSYSFQLKFLLFLLLITANTTLTLSARISIPPGVIQKVKSFGSQVGRYLWKNKMSIVKQFSPSQGENDQIKGLDLIKQYLFDFGYLKQKGPYDISLDKTTKSAIKTYEETFNLPDNGFPLNTETLQQISFPRCGVPDTNFEYSLTGTNYVSFPKGNNWFPKDKKLLTYAFAPQSETPLDMIQVFENAFTQWSRTIMVLNFERASSYDVADIKIGFYNYNIEGVEDVVVGDSYIILKNSYTSGVISLDASKYWLLPTDNTNHPSWEEGKFDLETVAMHQIGHLLGLDHSFETNSIMYPIILPSNQKKVLISDSDIKNMHQLYNNANYGKFGSSYSLLTSLFIGFAFVAMFN